MVWPRKLTLPVIWQEHAEESSDIALLGPILNASVGVGDQSHPSAAKVKLIMSDISHSNYQPT